MNDPISEEYRRVFYAAPFITDLGVELVAAGEGECTTSLELEERHWQQDGFVHAGVQAALADHTAGAAAATLLREHKLVLSIEFKINLLRPARGESLSCHAKVIKPGVRISVVEAEVFCTSGNSMKMVSKMTATMAIVDPES